MLCAIEKECVQTDGELIALARAGSKDAFGKLIHRHYPACVNIASYMLRDRSEAKDEVQKACWKAFRHLDQYHGDSEFLPWMLRIVVNQCLMLLRVRRRTRFLYIDAGSGHDGGRPIELPAVALDPEHEVIKQEMKDILKMEIRRIPPLLRTVMILRDVEELPMMHVAARLGITVPAAKSRLLRARSELRQRVIQRCASNGNSTADMKSQRLPSGSVRSVWKGANSAAAGTSR
jgi:RNA polymerase sigma-70 factor (ECF subfamily)